MIAIYDINNSLSPRIKSTLRNKDIKHINSLDELIYIFKNELQNYSEVLINSSLLTNKEITEEIIPLIKTPLQRSKVLLYDISTPRVSIINNDFFKDDILDKTDSIDEVFARLKKISNAPKLQSEYKHIVIGVSTGGPSTLEKVIPLFPKDLGVSIVVIQHILRGNYIYKICERLNKISNVDVKVAENGEVLKKGTVYFPPPGVHLSYKKERNGDVSIVLSEEYKKRGESALFTDNYKFVHIPSVDIGIESASDTYKDSLVAVILTGMGSDGAIALKYARQNGAHTLSESEATSIVYGMPKAAFNNGGSMEVLKHYLIPGRILELMNYKNT